MIKQLEKRFLKHHYAMDEASEKKDWDKASLEATLSIEICEILAEVRQTSSDYELDRLYKKYNLQKEQ